MIALLKLRASMVEMIEGDHSAVRLLERLKWGSTWGLVGLTVITYGVYLVYYARRQTLILNEFSPPDKQIGLNYIRAWFVVTYGSLALFFVYFFVPNDSVWAEIGNFADRLDGLLGLIWAFLARNSFHRLLTSQKGTPNWMHGLWTFLFQALYFNFKVNRLSEVKAQETSVAV